MSEGQFRLKPGSKVTALKPGETPAAPTEAELKAAQAEKSDLEERWLAVAAELDA